MSFYSWLRALKGLVALRDARLHQPPRRPRRRTPVLESLEDRYVPAAPVALADAFTVTEGAAVTSASTGVNVLTNDTDADGGTLKAVLNTAPTHGKIVLNADGSFTYTHDGSEATSDSFTYSASDGVNVSAPVAVSITVTPVNDAPVATADTFDAAAGRTLSGNVLTNDTDAEGSALTAALVAGASNGTLNLDSNGTFTYTPNNGFTGTDGFTYKANDGSADGNTVTVTINVDATTYVNDTWNFVTDADSSGDLSLGDIVNNANDGGGLTATYGVNAFGTVTTGAETGTAAAYDTITEAIAATAADGTVSVLAGTYNEDVSVSVSGITLQGAGANVTTISGPIGGDTATISVGASNVTVAGFTITRAGNNATDWENPNLNSAGLSANSQTGLSVRDNIFFGNRTGLDINNSSGAVIRNNVIDSNRTGIIFGNTTQNTTLTENQITNNFTVGVLFLDRSTPTGSNTPAQSSTGSTFSNNNISGNWYGEVVDRQTGGSLPAPGGIPKDFEYNWFGTTSPVVTTNNSAEPAYGLASLPAIFGGTATAPSGQPDIAGAASANIDYLPLLVSGVDTDVETAAGRGTLGFQGNLPPTAVDDVFTVSEDGGLGGSLVLNDTDPQGTTLTAVLESSPNNGTLTVNADGTFVYKPDADFFGTDFFTYRAGDGTQNSANVATVTITVTAVNDAPVANNDAASTAVNTPVTINVVANDSGGAANEGQTLTVTGVTQGSNGTVVNNNNGTVTYTPNANFTGEDTFTYTITDGGGLTSTGTVRVSVGFFDDFNRANNPSLGASWVDNQGDFQVSGNRAVSAINGVSISTLAGVSRRDVAVQADVSIAAGSNTSVGLLARYSGPGDSNFYLAEVYGRPGLSGAVEVNLYRNLGGSLALLGRANIAGMSATGTLRFEAYGSTQKVFFNDALILSANDTTLDGAGGVGVRGGESPGAASFDNFLYVPITLTGATLPFPADNFSTNYSPADRLQLKQTYVENVGNVRVEGGDASNNTPLALATLRGVSVRDVAVQADINIAAGTDNAAGLVARYSGPGDANYYLAEVYGDPTVFGGVEVNLYRQAMGQMTLLGTTVITGASATGTLRFEVVGSSQKVFLNDSLVLFANDTTLDGAGSAGFRLAGTINAVAVDNFSAAARPASNVILPFTDTFSTAERNQLGAVYTERLGNFRVDTVTQTASNATGLAIATLNGLNAGAMTLKADVNLAYGSNGSVALLGRYNGTGEGTGYLAEMYAVGGIGSSVRVNLYRRNVGGSLTLLATGTTADNVGTLELALNGPSLTLRMDGVTLLTATDGTFAAGTAGLRLSGTPGGVVVDNFRVTTP